MKPLKKEFNTRPAWKWLLTNLLFVVIVMNTTLLHGHILRVGPNKQYAKPSDVVSIAANSDTIEIDATLYAGDVAAWTQDNLAIRGAGIRQEGSGLTVRNCYFHDNENGILGADGPGEVLIEYCEFANNGFGDGFTHNMYILHASKFTLRYSNCGLK